MKKIFVSALAVLFVLSFAGLSFASVDSIYEVAIVNMSGDVQVDIKGDGTWMRPWIGMKLMQDAMIKTGSNSTADIVFDAEGLNVLRVSENTEIAVDRSMVHLLDGSVMADFANLKGGSSFTVKTPTAACAIRGSAMGVDFINGMTVVMAFQDKVYVQGLDSDGNPVGAEVTIPEGWKSQVEQDGNVTPPEGLSENELMIFEAFVAAVQDEAGDAPADAMPGEITEEVDTKDLDEVMDKKDGDEEDVISPSGSSPE
jgi:Fe-S cluster assembly iron-binding protein IscA